MRAQDCRGTMIIRIRMHMGSHVMFALKKRSRVSTSFFYAHYEKTFPQKLLTRKLRTFDKYFARLHCEMKKY